MPKAKEFAAVLGVLAGLIILVPLVVAATAPAAVEGVSWIGPWIWETRALDVLVQGLVLLAAVIGVVILLGRQP